MVNLLCHSRYSSMGTKGEPLYAQTSACPSSCFYLLYILSRFTDRRSTVSRIPNCHSRRCSRSSWGLSALDFKGSRPHRLRYTCHQLCITTDGHLPLPFLLSFGLYAYLPQYRTRISQYGFALYLPTSYIPIAALYLLLSHTTKSDVKFY